MSDATSVNGTTAAEAPPTGLLLLAAMVAGASGDGHVGERERSYLLSTAAELPGLARLTADERAVLVDEAIAALAGADARSVLRSMAAAAGVAERRAAYALACLAALADGVATDAELDHLLDVRDGLLLADDVAEAVEDEIRRGTGVAEVFEDDGISWRFRATPA